MYFTAFNVLFFTSNCCMIMVAVNVYDGSSSGRKNSLCFCCAILQSIVCTFTGIKQKNYIQIALRFLHKEHNYFVIRKKNRHT